MTTCAGWCPSRKATGSSSPGQLHRGTTQEVTGKEQVNLWSLISILPFHAVLVIIIFQLHYIPAWQD